MGFFLCYSQRSEAVAERVRGVTKEDDLAEMRK